MPDFNLVLADGRPVLAMTAAILAYMGVMVALGFWAERKVKTHEDYIVAGRRLPLWLNTFTLLATWFGAGTLLTSTDEIYASGLGPALLEPYGAGCALLLAGLFFAKPLWKMKLFTITDFYKNVYGPKIELICVVSSVLGFAGWIAVQLVALAGVTEIFFGLPQKWGIGLIALVTMFYTLLGGMWSVAVTDFVQLIVIILGLSILGHTAFASIGHGSVAAGLHAAASKLDPKDLVLIPHGSAKELLMTANLFLAAALGNIPSQDLGQRLFAARSASVARYSCFLAGFVYIVVGSVPVALGLAAKAFFPDMQHSVIPALAKMFLTPGVQILFLLAIFSAVLSTIDSAILAPATTMAHNGLRRVFPESVSTLTLCRWSVVAVSAGSVLIAYSGEKAYDLLEACYSIGLAGFFAPLVIGLLVKKPNRTGGIVSMAAGMALWPLEFFTDGVPVGILAAAAGFAAYALYDFWDKSRTPASAETPASP